MAIQVLPRSFKIRVRQAITKCIPQPVLLAISYQAGQNGIARMLRKSARSFQLLKDKKGLKLHLGCGQFIKLGWVNIDVGSGQLPPDIDLAAHPDTVLIQHDLRFGLPLEEGSCDYIYSSHFFEHLTAEEGFRLMRECYLKLQPGGIFRIAQPRFREAFAAYLQGNNKWFEPLEEHVHEVLPGIKTVIDYVNFSVYQDGDHKCVYDEERTIQILRSLGYSSVALSSYQEGMDPDSATHRHFSFYVEAVK